MKKGIRLNVVISVIILVGACILASINFYTSAKVLKMSLKDNYLKSNYNYTNKLAEGVEYFTENLQKSIIAFADLEREQPFNQNSLDKFFMAEKRNFSSIFIADTNGEIQLISPKEIQTPEGLVIKAGSMIDKKIIQTAIKEKKPSIIEPYVTSDRNLLVHVTAPVLDDKENVKGVMVGTVYLYEDNAINYLLRTHKNSDGTVVYVIDKNGRIVFHPETAKLFTDVRDDPVVATILKQEKGGYQEFTDSNNRNFFAGYSYITPFKWGIIAMTPSSSINDPLMDLLFKMLSRLILVALVLVVVVVFLMKTLTKPLTQLAEYSEGAILSNKITKIKDPTNVHSHIYEVKQLSRQVQNHIKMLNREIQIDGLTGLANRRTFDATIKEWVEIGEEFSLALIDIDNFKKINDTYGHLVGDDVIKFLTEIIDSFKKEDDLSFRYGGEEFGLLLKSKSELKAFEIVEKLREKVASTPCPTGECITVSIGLTSFKKGDIHPHPIIERADKALYRSKRTGKNKTTIYNECEVPT